MSSKAFPHTLPMVIVVAVAASLLIGTALSGFAQLDTESDDTFSGTVNSLVQEGGETSYVIGGDWQLSTEGGNVADFSAELTMAKNDGTGVHTHRIVIAEGDIGFEDPDEQDGNLTDGEESDEIVDAGDGDVTVTLTPLEQNPGGSLLVNASGLVPNNETSIHVGDIAAGNPEADSDGNVLFALGITEEMTGSAEVTVTDGQNSGSATFTVIELPENETDTETGPEVTGTETGNLTGTLPSNATETTDESGNVTGDMVGNLTGMEDSTETQPSSDQTGGSIYGQEILGQYGGPADTGTTSTTDESADDVTDMGDTTLDTANATSTETEQTAGITVTYDLVADIYTDGELKWEDVNVTVSIMNGALISIEIDPVATENHFGEQPLFGFVA